MKTCPYCGTEYSDDTTECVIDKTPLTPPVTPPPAPPEIHTPRAEYEFSSLTEEQEKMDFVTLVRCGTLMAADLVVSRLRAAEIDAFIPDQSVVQAIGYNLSAVGFVRVQVSPADYEQAKAIISDGLTV